MTVTQFDRDDARADRLAALREERAANRRAGTPADAAAAAPVVRPTPATVAKPPSARPAPAPEPAINLPFAPVDELPKAQTGKGRTRRPIPPARAALIEYCRSRPGQWVCYTPTPEQDKVRPATLVSMPKRSHGGFTPAFEVRLRNKKAYVRFNGDS
ncbi:hypothetical protein SEA_THIMANN_52 [Gordonia phage Thimann]|nr:hypothetical protein SEA_THIMANN_52 [Gordonia phage Thimann]